MIAFLLWLLATIDAAFVGYREAAGRNALIDKKKYYLKAMLRGAIFGQIAVLISLAVILILLALSNEPAQFLEDLQNAGKRMLFVYIPFALIILAAFVIRLYPSVDIKSITSTVIFGPFTLLRPIVAVAGIIYGFINAPTIPVIFLSLIVLILMLGLEKFLEMSRRKKYPIFFAETRTK